MIGKVWAQRLQAQQAANGVLRGPVQDQARAALLAVLEYEDDSLRRAQQLVMARAPRPLCPWHGKALLQGLAEGCLGEFIGHPLQARSLHSQRSWHEHQAWMEAAC